jgi:glucose/arabinose dehydrogenase
MYRLAIFGTALDSPPEIGELQLFDDTPPRPSAPAGLSTEIVSTREVRLAWADTSTNELEFQIERRKESSGAYESIATVAANLTTYSDTSVLAGTSYTYRVRASNVAGQSSYSPESSAATPPPTVTVNEVATADRTPSVGGAIDDATAAVTVVVAGRSYAAVNRGDGTWTVADNVIDPPLTAGLYDVQVSAADSDGSPGVDPTTGELTVYSSVVNRRLLYINSRFDAISDAEGIAPDKVALLPGQTATFENYTSYSRGINGIVIDIAGLKNDVEFAPTDFQFQVGNSNDSDTWSVAPAPASVSTRAGPGGTKRALIIWPDNAIQNQWLQVTVKANATTSLRNADSFFFGNAIGESGNSNADALVTAIDQSGARNNPRSFPDFAEIDNPYDFNRDGLVSSIDQNIARNNAITPDSSLRLITPLIAQPTVIVDSTDTAATEEGGDNGSFIITRSGQLAEPLFVEYTITGTAENGTDYVGLNGTLVIPVDNPSATITVAPIDDTIFEGPETVVLTLQTSGDYVLGTPTTATVTITEADANNPPSAPVITEPLTDTTVVSGADVHMEIGPFADLDPGQTRLDSDWEIWTTDEAPLRVWHAHAATDARAHHIHFGDGAFEGPQSGKSKLEPETEYELRVRTRDNSGAANNTSPWALRRFRTFPEEVATADGWVAQQPDFRVEEVPFIFAPGEPDWRLPTNIAFVPDSIRGTHPSDPLFYVVELYGSIRVVTNDLTVRTYASALLNYNPLGHIGWFGATGLTGIAVDPDNGDLYVTMLYDDPDDATGGTFPKITRLASTDGGLSMAQQTDILRMPGEAMQLSHLISNITFGPDDKLYVHVGDGFFTEKAQDLQSFRGKILRLNRDGSAPPDNPFYDPLDRGDDGGADAEDYVFASGLRNPFGGAWRDADASVNRPAQHFTVENGPGRDRLSLLVPGRNYLWDGTDESMTNFNIAYSPTGTFENGADDWQPALAPINIAFVQQSNFNYSQFPLDKRGHAFVSQSGPTQAQGPNFAKSIQEWVLNDDGTRRVSADGEPPNPRELVSYEGAGYSTAAGLAAGPDGLYFSTLFPDTDPVGTNRGAKILRVVYTGASPAPAKTITVSAAHDDAGDSPAGIANALSENSQHAIPADSTALEAIFGEPGESPTTSTTLAAKGARPLAAHASSHNRARVSSDLASTVVESSVDSLPRRPLATMDLIDALAHLFSEDHEIGRIHAAVRMRKWR